MKFEVSRSSSGDFGYETEINTLEQLLKFVAENGPTIITTPIMKLKEGSIHSGPWLGGKYELEIYDDYRE